MSWYGQVVLPSPSWATLSIQPKSGYRPSRPPTPSTVSACTTCSFLVPLLWRIGPTTLPCSAAGPLDVVRKTLKWEGPAGLYKVRMPCQQPAQASPVHAQLVPHAPLCNMRGWTHAGRHIATGRADVFPGHAVWSFWRGQALAVHQPGWHNKGAHNRRLLQGLLHTPLLLLLGKSWCYMQNMRLCQAAQELGPWPTCVGTFHKPLVE